MSMYEILYIVVEDTAEQKSSSGVGRGVARWQGKARRPRVVRRAGADALPFGPALARGPHQENQNRDRD
jgi:hypothetical protein